MTREPNVAQDALAPEAAVVGDGYGHEPEAQPNPLLAVHRLLEGRYVWAVGLAIVLAAAGAVLGYMIPKPVYRSVGAIRYRPVVQRVLYESEETGVMPMFDAFVGEQADLIKRQRVVDMAMTDDAWKRLGRKITPKAQQEFLESLDVMHEKRSTIVAVAFRDPDANAAQVAVKAVVDAYMNIYGESSEVGDSERMRILEQLRTSLSGQLSSLRQRVLSIANEFGSDALEQMYTFKVEQLNQIETELVDVGMELAAAGVSASQDQQPEQVDISALTADEVAARDDRMRGLLERRDQAMEQAQILKYRYGANHPRSKRAQEDLAAAEASVQTYLQKVRSGATSLARSKPGDRGGGMSVRQLRDRQVHLRELYSHTRTEMLDLGRKKLQIDNLRVEMESVQKRLDDTKFRIDQLALESMRGGRIDVVSRGDRPILPYEDKRVQASLIGGVAGGAMGVGLFLVVGLLGTRMRSSTEACAAAAHIRLLGMLPNLPDDLSDPEQIAVAGYSVHHIRTLLQLRPHAGDHQVFAVTGSASGTGKTSLTLALGISFAASGAKTLLVDFDMAGGGLTSRLEAILRRRAGAVLQSSGLITKAQLEEALRLADRQHVQLSAALVELGILSKEQLNGKLALREGASRGLLDVLGGGSLDDFVVDTGVDGVDVLPVGGARAHDMSRVSPASVRRLMQEVRHRYDVVLVDTGPIPGSVEAPIVAAQADGVVLMVSQGDRRNNVASAFDLLYSIGARVEGLVYNRARTRDMARSNYSSSLSASVSRSGRSGYPVDAYEESWADPSESLQQACYGPVARAVITSAKPGPSERDDPVGASA